jgi:hypothetical protein
MAYRLPYHLQRAYALLNEQADRDYERSEAEALKRSIVMPPVPAASPAVPPRSTERKRLARHAGRCRSNARGLAPDSPKRRTRSS